MLDAGDAFARTGRALHALAGETRRYSRHFTRSSTTSPPRSASVRRPGRRHGDGARTAGRAARDGSPSGEPVMPPAWLPGRPVRSAVEWCGRAYEHGRGLMPPAAACADLRQHRLVTAGAGTASTAPCRRQHRPSDAGRAAVAVVTTELRDQVVVIALPAGRVLRRIRRRRDPKTVAGAGARRSGGGRQPRLGDGDLLGRACGGRSVPRLPVAAAGEFRPDGEYRS